MAGTRRGKSNGKVSAAWAQPGYDVSIILNLHDEARYLRRTLRSLEEAVDYAKPFDISFELVVVIDNGDEATTRLVEEWDYDTFDAHKVIHVKNASLGLSRNDGIAVARGDFIATADADDLIAFDYFQKMYMTASSSRPKTIVFPEFYFGFGIDCYIWKFYSHDFIGNAAFYDKHPYISRVMFRKEFSKEIVYADVSLSSGYAYEDWHFNCQCLAAGFAIEIASGAMLFYRQRPGSLLRRADNETSRHIPPSKFYEPATFLKLTWSEFAGEGALPGPKDVFRLGEFLERPGVADIVAAANRLDPAISLGILRHRHAGSNLEARSSPAAAAYFALCEAVAGHAFTDVVLLPFLTKGGAEKYILSVLDALCEGDPSRRVLFLLGQRFERHGWFDRLPHDSMVFDFYAEGIVGLDQEAVMNATFRLIQNLDSIERIHAKPSEYADQWIRRYARMAEKNVFLYYFCEGTFTADSITFTNGFNFDLISECIDDVGAIISDNHSVLDFLSEAIGCDIENKCHTLYNICDLPASAAASEREPGYRLLWASRLDEQKRPHLAAKIAERLADDQIGVTIDAYGETTYGVIGPAVFDGAEQLSYRGAYDGFDQLPAHEYDAFLYTAAFDGMPNVVLEAMAAGLPVIAPAVGGIPEAVKPRTGYLVVDDADEEVVVDRFVEAIRAMYADWPEARLRGANGRALVATRHSRRSFGRRVNEVFLTRDRAENRESSAISRIGSSGPIAARG